MDSANIMAMLELRESTSCSKIWRSCTKTFLINSGGSKQIPILLHSQHTVEIEKDKLAEIVSVRLTSSELFLRCFENSYKSERQGFVED
jgi:hypothetical protein